MNTGNVKIQNNGKVTKNKRIKLSSEYSWRRCLKSDNNCVSVNNFLYSHSVRQKGVNCILSRKQLTEC